jgi:ABC-type nitrate/sulfonate/bicarbonate transport system substrate-binding protein
MQSMNRRRLGARGLAIGGATILMASLAGGGATLGQDAPFTPEDPNVTLGYRLPSLNSIAALLVAQDRGYWQECGLESVELIQTEEVLPGLVSGSLDTGLVETVDFGQASVDQLPIKLIAGYRPYSRNVIAVHPSITSVEDLDGKDVLLGGTPGTLDFDVRFNMLKEAGYDLSTVNPNYVAVEGGSDAWVALLEQGQLFMTPIFNRHIKRLQDQGVQFWVDNLDFGSDHVGAGATWVEQNPQSAAAFLCGLIQGIQVWTDPANMDYIMGLGEAQGIEITDDIRNAYVEDIKNYAPFDGGWDMSLMEGLFDEIVTPDVPDDVDYETLLALDPLHAAQESLGLAPNPVVGGEAAAASPDAAASPAAEASPAA